MFHVPRCTLELEILSDLHGAVGKQHSCYTESEDINNATKKSSSQSLMKIHNKLSIAVHVFCQATKFGDNVMLNISRTV